MSGFKLRAKIQSFCKTIDSKFLEQFGFRIRDTNVRRITVYMHKPKDASSLAVTRILFGIAMLFDIPDERGGAAMIERWGNTSTCHFPLLNCVQAIPMPYMALVYSGLWFGATGIALGYKFRTSSAIFTACFWYLLLIEKSYWNNHSYLFGLIGFLLTFTRANCFWSVDVYKNPALASETVPYWNYFLLKYQFFILYFMAGLKKGTAEWLTGYSVQNLSEHWVFDPFKLFLTVPQTDYLIVHWFVFAFDLTIAVWMMWSRTRHVAMIFCALFHLMNSRLFRIGMFPWVCLATMPLFYPFDWPRRVFGYLYGVCLKFKTKICYFLQMLKKFKSDNNINNDQKSLIDNDLIDDDDSKAIGNEEESHEKTNDFHKNLSLCADTNSKNKGDVNEKINNKIELNETSEQDYNSTKEIDGKKIMTCLLIGLFVVIQAFLPFSHFITKGYNNWTNGLYGYSWDMMVHTWDVHSVVVKVVDNDHSTEFYVDPYHFTPNDRWTRHGDMVYQYARCLKRNLATARERDIRGNRKTVSENLSIYVDVWASLNGRFTQRMFDPKVDLLNASWSPFAPIPFLMPLLDEALEWRDYLVTMREAVESWSNYTDVLFIADFPGYEYEKYIPFELRNVTLTILDGLVVYEPELSQQQIGKSFKLQTGDWIKIPSGIFHKVLNIDSKPSFYMYTFYNSTDVDYQVETAPVPKLPITEELLRRFNNMIRFTKNIVTSLFSLFFNASKCQ